MSRRTSPQNKTDDTAFPVRIKVIVPERGMGQDSTKHRSWLVQHLGPGNFANHAATTIAGQATAYYFRDIQSAHDFLSAFPMLVLADATSGTAYRSPIQDGAWQTEDFFGVCNLYAMTSSQAAIREIANVWKDETGNLEPLKGIYPDYQAPVIRSTDDGRVMSMMRWGMPSPTFALKGKKTDRGVTNVRNTKSPHWRRWLGVEHRCVVPFTSFSEPHNRPGKPSEPVWFALKGEDPIGFFAGIWTRWTSVRKLKDGETTDNLFAFLTTEPNETVAAIHPKAMPVILTSADEVRSWLMEDASTALELQRPLADGELRAVT